MRCPCLKELYGIYAVDGPALNSAAYILPGLGDAGDRINGVDEAEHPRNMIQLIADYGATIAGLYRHQLRAIENVVLQNK